MKKINNYLKIYLLILLSFSFFFLHMKHQVINDSTISEWLINYEGGFTKRGLTGQIAIELSRFFELNLRLVILLLQCLVYSLYFFLLFNLLKNLKNNRIVLLSIFSPIFILYPVAEIEVLARKEIIVFLILLVYFLIPRNSRFKSTSFVIFTSLVMLIWEPIIFFFPLILIYEIIDNNIKKFDFRLFKILMFFIPSIFIALIIIFNPLTKNEHQLMVLVLNSEFGQTCYMSCGLLSSKSTIIQQFEGNFDRYSLEVFVRYIMIILIGSYPLITLIKNSSLKNNKIYLIKYLKNPLNIFFICQLPVIFLFAMGLDWGRWVNIMYVVLALIYFKLLKDNHIKLDYEKLNNTFFYKIKFKTFIVFFVIFCFSWNPKTVITGDVGSFPGYRIPYKVFKIITN